MERVSVREGNEPLIVVAPHGYDDTNTDLLAETIADSLDAWAVINRGWERARTYDYYKDHANCNYVPHVHEDVVKEEFLDPILNYVAALENMYDHIMVLIVHGVSNSIIRRTKGEPLDLIVGYGAGQPPRYSCEMVVKDALCYQFQKHQFHTYEAGPGSDYAGRTKNNLNQLFRQHYYKDNVHSIQLEVIKELRDDRNTTILTGELLANALDSLLNMRFDNKQPDDWDKILDTIKTI